jgi:glycosyltransferase involved in cell wall biosynthesis
MKSPVFSVITPSFNQGEYLGACLASVAGQGDEDYEHLVFDNCSTDRTAAVAAEFPRVLFRSEADRGQSHAINKGFAVARGEIICWLNSDDEYPPGLFARLREIFSDPGVTVVFGDVRQVSYDGKGEDLARGQFASRLDLVRWWGREVKLHQPAIFFRRSAREAAGMLREDLHFAMDYEYWWRMSATETFHYQPEVLAIQHRQPDSKTVRDWQRVYQERERIFSPFYGLVDGGNRSRLLAERRRVMAGRYLGEAFALASSSPREALSLLGKSFRENPASLLRPTWLGVVRRCFQAGLFRS